MSHDPSPLVGRASTLTAISRGARAGRGVVLTGAPGSGGTRLLSDAFAASRRAGLRTTRLAAAGESGALQSLVGREALGALPSGDRSALRAAALALGLEAVFLDDAVGIDEETGALLVDLARSGTAIVANATGTAGLPLALQRLIDEGRADAVPLAPLTRAEIAELAAHLLGDPVDGELALALETASGGRPRALTEVVDDGVGTRSIVHADGLWHLGAPLPPARSLRTAVLDAFAALAPEQRGWIAAVAQAGVLADDLARRVAAAETIRAAEEAGWTVRDPARPATRIVSEPVGWAVLGSLDLRARLAVLRRLVSATEAAGRPLLEDERVALMRWRIEVGLRPDPAEARALALLPGTEPAARELLLRAAVDGGAPADADLADHLRRTRRPAEALRLIDEALPGASEGGERVSLLRVRAMTTGIVERRSGETLAALDGHLLDAEPEPELLAVRASMLLLEGRPREAVEAASAVLEMPDRSGFATGFALLQLALGLREQGRLEAALDTAARLLAFDDVEQAFQDGRGLARWLPSELLVAVAAEPGAVEERVATDLAALLADGCPQRCAPLSYTLALIRLHRGDPEGAARLLRDTEAAPGAWREGWQPRVLAELLIAQTLSGALDEAASTADRLARITVPPMQRGRVELAAAERAHARGDSAAARAIADEVAVSGAAAGRALDAFDATFAAIRYGDEDAPRRLLDLGPLPGGTGRDAQRAYASALVDADADAVDAAAIRLWDIGLRLFAIEAGLRAAELGSAAADRRLVAWLTRAPALRLPGLSGRRVTGLTAREREVAVLAAGGASDRAIATELGITLRTAQTHLGRALGKLGIHRRGELRGLVGEP